MRTRRFASTALRPLMLGAGVMFLMAAHTGAAHAQGVIAAPQPQTGLTVPQTGLTVPQTPLGLTVPQTPEMPVSPITPGTAPGTTAQDIGIGVNPITGLPCLGGGASAINGGLPSVSTAPDQTAQTGVAGLPPSTSVYGLSNQLPNTLTAGAC
jgi:hypothetical protein